MARLRLYTGQPGTSAAAIITATSATTITAAVVENPAGSPVTLSVWIVPSGATEADANILYDAFSVAVSTSAVGLPALVGQTLNAGDAIYASASAGSSLTLHVSGDR